jgi:hypothetical protein
MEALKETLDIFSSGFKNRSRPKEEQPIFCLTLILFLLELPSWFIFEQDSMSVMVEVNEIAFYLPLRHLQD